MTQQQSPVWFITGCSTGFGKELARLVLARGWRAVVTARNPDQLKELVSGKEKDALAVQLDVTNRAQIAQAVQQAEKKFGQINVLVNNAGYGYIAAIEEGEEDQVRAMFETNFFGLVDLTKAVLPGMRKRHRGHIVNFSSIGGLVSFAATVYMELVIQLTQVTPRGCGGVASRCFLSRRFRDKWLVRLRLLAGQGGRRVFLCCATCGG